MRRRPPPTLAEKSRQHIGAVFVAWVVFILAVLAVCAIHNIYHNLP